MNTNIPRPVIQPRSSILLNSYVISSVPNLYNQYISNGVVPPYARAQSRTLYLMFPTYIAPSSLASSALYFVRSYRY